MFFSTEKKNELSSHEKTQRNLKLHVGKGKRSIWRATIKITTWIKYGQKTLTDISQKKIYRGWISTWRCPTANDIKEMKINTIWYHCTPVRMAKFWNTSNTKCCQNVEQQKFSFTAGGNAKWYSQFCGFFKTKYFFAMWTNHRSL